MKQALTIKNNKVQAPVIMESVANCSFNREEILKKHKPTVKLLNGKHRN
jgi:hypothetical protein